MGWFVIRMLFCGVTEKVMLLQVPQFWVTQFSFKLFLFSFLSW